jgi:hypothetical protein
MNEDALVKLGMQTLLGPFVRVETQHEVQPPAQFVDVFVATDATDPALMERTLGTLGVMACALCMLEAFSKPVPLAEARHCMRKQLTLHHTLELKAAEIAASGGTPLEVPLPVLWMLSWGRPTTLLAAWGMTAAPGWPEGFYRAPEGLAAWVVVLPELPRTRETLPLRLFGDERTRRSLLQEIAALGAGDPMGTVVRGMLKTWVLWVRGQPQDEHTRRWLMDFEQVVQAEIRKIERQGEERGEERGEKRGEERGEKRGEERGLRAAVRDLCELLGIALTAEQQAHIEALDLAGLGVLRAHLKQHRAWPAS